MQYIACIEVIEKKLNGSASLKLEILEEWLMVINVLIINGQIPSCCCWVARIAFSAHPALDMPKMVAV